MELTDNISVLWTEEIYEADLGSGAISIQEAGNPFSLTLIESVLADTTEESLSSDAYRQISYVNDINRVHAEEKLFHDFVRTCISLPCIRERNLSSVLWQGLAALMPIMGNTPIRT